MVYKCVITETEKGERGTAYTYFKDDKPIGRLVITKKNLGKWKGWYLLSNVVIYPEFRGLGFCGKMLKCVLKKYANEKIYLEVKEGNIPAVKCYIESGFEIQDKIKKLLIMIK